MRKHTFFLATLILVLAIPAHGQPKKPPTPLEAVEALSNKASFNAYQGYLRLMDIRPWPKEVAPALSKVVASQTGDARILAAALLTEVTPTDANLATAITSGLPSKDNRITAVGLKGLGNLGALAKPALPKVLAALDSPDAEVRMAAIKPAAVGGKDAVNPIDKIIRKAAKPAGKKFKRNEQAAMALGKIGPDAVPAILKLLDGDDPEMDYYAALALAAMDKKPVEALKPILRLTTSKDFKVRRPVFDYLVAVAPSPAVNDALWIGLDDRDTTISGKCRLALRDRNPDKAKWLDAMKKSVGRLRSSDTSSFKRINELYELDRQAALPFLHSMTLAQISDQFSPKWLFAVIATKDKELVPIMPDVYKYLDGPSTGRVNGRINAIHLLKNLPPERTRPVVAKIQNDLKAPRWELKLVAAEALLRTNPADKTAIAKAFAEVLATPKLPYDFPYDDVLAQLRSMGAAAASAAPGLRVAQTTAPSHIRGKFLMTMVALDPQTKADVIAIAEKMRQDAKDPYAGTAVLLELGVIKAEDAVKTFTPGVETSPPNMAALRAIDIAGPKLKALVPKLEANLADPNNYYSAQAAIAIASLENNPKASMDRYVKMMKADPKKLGVLAEGCARFGAAARPIVPDLLATRKLLASVSEFDAALVRIDPTAYFLAGN